MFLIFVNVDSVVCMPSRQALKEKTITHNMSIMSYLSYEELKTHLTWLNIGKVFLDEENKAWLKWKERLEVRILQEIQLLLVTENLSALMT